MISHNYSMKKTKLLIIILITFTQTKCRTSFIGCDNNSNSPFPTYNPGLLRSTGFKIYNFTPVCEIFHQCSINPEFSFEICLFRFEKSMKSVCNSYPNYRVFKKSIAKD